MKSFSLSSLVATLVALIFLAPPTRAAESKIEFTQEKLDNGLTVIYAPLHQAPVIHVRVAYHVGSKDERPDRQGFAHMFEHMMFRGSAHVKPEEHMKLIGVVGGNSNAFTSYDETTYVNTIPSNQLEMALYLEADRMSSFKVSEEIYRTERKVVGEEWGMHANNPGATIFDDFINLAYTTHSYRWTPIGNMDHLKAAPVEELQDFFNTYYIPNNATLLITGDFDLENTKKLVRKYYGWIPKGADIVRNAKPEPEQTELRRATVPKAMPLPVVLIGYHIPEYKSEDQYALSLLAGSVGAGASSRVNRLLVSGDKPLCVNATSVHEVFEDSGFFGFHATVMQGKSADEVEKALLNLADEIVKNGVTEDELKSAKARAKEGWIHQRVTAESIASALTGDTLFGGDPNRANTELDKINALTTADLQRVAAKYIRAANCDILVVKPDAAAAMKALAAAPPTTQTAVAPSTRPVVTRKIEFPADYPQTPPLDMTALKTTFQKGTETAVNGIKVLVLPDPRIPTVTFSLTMRRGSHTEPDDKLGLAGITTRLMGRGAGDLNYEQFSRDLESRVISISASDGGDITRISGSCPTQQVDHAFTRTREVLLSPKFDATEFEKLKQQSLSEMKSALEQPDTAASWELSSSLYGGSPLGRHSTPETLKAITLDDVKQYYSRIFVPNDAILCIAGDITVEKAQELAAKLLEGWKKGELANIAYNFPPVSEKPRIVLVDRPEGRQAVIRFQARAYNIQDDAKYPGHLAGSILSHGIEGRLNRYVRAEKGYVYGCWGVFGPGRQAGSFHGGAETSFKTTADTIEAMFKVFTDMQKANVTDQEMNEAKMRVVGGMVMSMQTIQQQAGMRVEAMLNDYPIDYYDLYPQKVSAVTADQVRDLVNKYVQFNRMTFVVIAPADQVKDQLQRLGQVEVIPMPSQRGAAPTTKELIKPAAQAD